jgi:hypothetical protein
MKQYELGRAFCDEVVAAGGHRRAQPRLVVARGAPDARGDQRTVRWLERTERPPPERDTAVRPASRDKGV